MSCYFVLGWYGRGGGLDGMFVSARDESVWINAASSHSEPHLVEFCCFIRPFHLLSAGLQRSVLLTWYVVIKVGNSCGCREKGSDMSGRTHADTF